LFLGSVLYHALVTFLVTGLSMTNGWYLYCVIFPEVLLLVGLMALVPGDWRKWIIPHGMIAAVALDWFGMHAHLLPYYLGLIAHEADSHLQTFHLFDISRTGLAEVLLRLETNRPYLGNWKIFATLWAVYMIATVVCLGIGLAVSLQPNLASRAAMSDLNLSTKPRT
jgi:hypothetical protein